MQDYLFVYGTLLPSLVPPRLRGLVERLRSMGPAAAPGRLYDLGDYPGATFGGPPDSLVLGEVFELPDDGGHLAALDSYEGFDPRDPEGSPFVRQRRLVTLAAGRQLDCWVYAYNRDLANAPRIVGGQYAAWRASKSTRPSIP